jgi:hypothetical protein
MSDDEKSFEDLLAASSFGTPGALALRERTPPDVAEAIVARVDADAALAYARCGENSDVYVYASMPEDDRVTLNCMNCPLSSLPFTFIARSRPQMLQHLNEHIARKHKVGTAILRLEREIEAGEKP